MSNKNNTGQKRMMDGETAIAFAGYCFQQLHPQSSCPDWLGRCTTVSYHKDNQQQFIVSFAVTPKSTNDAVSYFRVRVDAKTAETTVLLDRGLSDFAGEELQGFHPSTKSPWVSAECEAPEKV